MNRLWPMLSGRVSPSGPKYAHVWLRYLGFALKVSLQVCLDDTSCLRASAVMELGTVLQYFALSVAN